MSPQGPQHCPPVSGQKENPKTQDSPRAAEAGMCLPLGKEVGEGPEKVSSPEEGVMLYADLPEPLG